jgi:hypothetical protein
MVWLSFVEKEFELEFGVLLGRLLHRGRRREIADHQRMK